MASINSTPAEIWQLILRYVINVPVFLDPDGVADFPANSTLEYHVHLTSSSWNDEGPYWATERFRNVCRRVCRAWDAYLGQTVGHRFIRVQDVINKHVPASALNRAIRISAAYYPLNDPTSNGILKFNWLRPPEWSVSVAAFVALIPKDCVSNTQILIARTVVFQPSDLAILARQLPNLVTIVHKGRDSESVPTFKHFPRLLHLYTVPPRRDVLGRMSFVKAHRSKPIGSSSFDS
jgi:hypothetical protein